MKKIDILNIFKIMMIAMVALIVIVIKNQLKLHDDFYLGIATVVFVYIFYLLIKIGDKGNGWQEDLYTYFVR